MRSTSTVIIAGMLIVLLTVMLTGLAFVAFGPGAMMGGSVIGGAMMRGMMGGMMGSTMMPAFGFSGAHMIVGPILWALVIGGGLLSVMWLVQRSGASTSNTSGQQTAIDILKMRFATGEITKEQFEDMRRVVGAGASG